MLIMDKNGDVTRNIFNCFIGIVRPSMEQWAGLKSYRNGQIFQENIYRGQAVSPSQEQAKCLAGSRWGDLLVCSPFFISFEKLIDSSNGQRCKGQGAQQAE